MIYHFNKDLALPEVCYIKRINQIKNNFKKILKTLATF